MTRSEEIVARLREVRERLDKAARAAGRSPADVTLLAVSKTTSAEDVSAALSDGQTELAESYGQEFRDKQKAVAAMVAARRLPEPRWHFIGPLQTNKVKYVAGQVALIHSIASEHVMAEVDRKAAALGVVQDCLVQVNVAGEMQKSGVAPSNLAALLDSVAGLEHVRCTGLMVIPPYDEDAEKSRPHFRALRQLFEAERQHPRKNVDLQHLSMGMSHDLEVAIAEGATVVRVGTAIFGERK